LRPLPGDVPFVSAVKRFARAQGWTSVDLAEKLGVEVSTIHRHLHTRSRRPHLDTVREYARVLGVPEAYLRLAAGHVDEKPDAEALGRTAVAVFNALGAQLKDGALAELWERFMSSSRSTEVASMIYVDSLRRAAEVASGLVPEGDLRGLLVAELARIGIDVSPYRKTKPKLAYRIALVLSSLLSHEDADAVLTLLEQRLADRGDDIRSFRRERLDFKRNGLMNYIELVRRELPREAGK